MPAPHDNDAVPNAPGVPPSYWLGVAQGATAVRAFLDITSLDDALRLIEQHPILVLAEMPDAIDELAGRQSDPRARQLGAARAKTLRQVQAVIRQDNPLGMASMLKACAFRLIEESGGSRRVNLERAARLFGEAREFYPPGGTNFADCLLNEGSARSQLAKLGAERRANLEAAVALARQARPLYPAGSQGFLLSLRNEGSARQDLARMAIDERTPIGADMRANLEEAISLNRSARAALTPDNIEYARNLLDEANAHTLLGLGGIDPAANFKEAVRLYPLARAAYPPGHREGALCMANEARTRIKLANLGLDARENFAAAVSLCEQSYSLFDPFEDTAELVNCFVQEADGRVGLARLGVDGRANLDTAIKRYLVARNFFADDKTELPQVLAKQAAAHSELAESGVAPEENLRAAIELLRQAEALRPPGSHDLAATWIDLGIAHNRLSILLGDARAGGEEALRLHRAARSIFPHGSLKYAKCLTNEGRIHIELGDRGVDPRANYERAVELLGEARGYLAPGSGERGLCLRVLASAHLSLERLGVNQKAHLDGAVRALAEARESYPVGSVEYATCLTQEVVLRQQAQSDFGVSTTEDLLRTVEILRETRAAFPPDSENFGVSLFNEGNTFLRLAEQGYAPAESARRAVDLYRQARANLSTTSEEYAKCLINEGSALQELADIGVEARANLERKLELLREAANTFPRDGEQHADLLLNEATALARLADIGVEARANLERAVALSVQARALYPPGSVMSGRGLVAEASLRKELAGIGVDARRNSEEAIKLSGQARTLLPPGSTEMARALINEGLARKLLAGLGVAARANLEESLRLFEAARAIFPPEHVFFARCLMNEGNSRQSLAELGVETVWNYERAVELYLQARELLPPETTDAAVCFMYEGNARWSLAELDVSARENAVESIRLYVAAREIFLPDSPDAARSLVLEANARQQLAGLGDDARGNLETALGLYGAAREIFLRGNLAAESGNPDFANCVVSHGASFFALAEIGVGVEENLSRALAMFREGRELFPPESASYARCLVNEALAQQRLAARGVADRENWRPALDAFGRAARLFVAQESYRDATAAYEGQAWVANKLGLAEECGAALAAAIGALEQVRTDTLLARDRREWMEKNEKIFRDMIDNCLARGRFEDAAEYVERARSRALLDMLHARDFEPRNYPPEKVAAYREMRERAEVMEAARPRGPLPARAGAAGELEAALAREKARLVAELRAMEDEMRRLDPDYFALARPAALPDMKGVADGAGRTLVIIWTGARRTAVFFVRPGGEFAHLTLPLGVPRLLEWMLGPPETPWQTGWMVKYGQYTREHETRAEREAAREAWADEIERAGRVIYEELLRPVHRRLREWGETRAAFVVGGLLGLLPLHAASWDDGAGARYLLDELEVTYAPSVWVLKRCLARRRERDVPVLTVATSGDRSPLLFTRLEVRRIGELVSGARGAAACTQMLDAQATDASVLRALAGHALSHFACHGKWDLLDPLASSVMLDDGELTLARLLEKVRLDETRLVVLSSCESGAGFEAGKTGEEFMGLPAGFIFAGARAVIGSLWSVLDPPTALLMIKLYENLLAGAGVTAALRGAQLWLRDLDADSAAALLRQGAEAVEPRLRQSFADTVERWVRGLGPRPFARPYYWGAFQTLGSPEPIFEVK